MLKPQLISGLGYKKLSAPALRTCLEDDDDKEAHELGSATAAEEVSMENVASWSGVRTTFVGENHCVGDFFFCATYGNLR